MSDRLQNIVKYLPIIIQVWFITLQEIMSSLTVNAFDTYYKKKKPKDLRPANND